MPPQTSPFNESDPPNEPSGQPSGQPVGQTAGRPGDGRLDQDLDDDRGSFMPFGDHLEDLRRRLIIALLGLVPVLVFGIAVGGEVLGLLLRPAQEALLAAGQHPTLQATGPFETFMSYVKVALIIALLMGSPWVLYQLWRFVAPGLYRSERRFVYVLVPLSGGLTAMSAAFLYWVMIPVVLAFLIPFGVNIGDRPTPTAPPPPGIVVPAIPELEADVEGPEAGSMWVNRDLRQLRVAVSDGSGRVRVYGTDLFRGTGVSQVYKISDYLSTVLSFAVALALGFQLPVVVLLLGWAGLVERAWLGRYRRHIALGLAVLSAVLTPADPVSLIALAVPMYLLFELGMLLLRIMPAARLAAEEDEDDPEAGGTR